MTPPRRPSTRRLLSKGDTRQALILGALKVLDSGRSLEGLSQRELTRSVGIVPTAFYRHFADMDALGLALVEASFNGLRELLDAVRKDTPAPDKLLRGTVKSVFKQIDKHRIYFRFIASERYGGKPAVRDAIRQELRLVHSELAVDLARFPALQNWSTADLKMLAVLIFNCLVALAEEALSLPRTDKTGTRDLMETAERQLRLILLGVPQWRSD